MPTYRIKEFISDAKKIMSGTGPLADRQAEAAERLSVLSRNDDLMRYGLALGPADASTNNFLLWREEPNVLLAIAQFDQHYVSPVHEHDHYWVIGCGYRGHDRWDMYERLDDGSKKGFADLKLVDRYDLSPGKTAIMPPPPCSIHSHNNQFDGSSLELIFSMAEPSDPSRRIVYDVEEQVARLSWWQPGGLYQGGDYPGNRLARSNVAGRMADAVRRVTCPICDTLRHGASIGRWTPSPA